MWNGTPGLVRTEPLVSKYALSSIREWPLKKKNPCAVCKTHNGVQLKTRCQNWGQADDVFGLDGFPMRLCREA